MSTVTTTSSKHLARNVARSIIVSAGLSVAGVVVWISSWVKSRPHNLHPFMVLKTSHPIWLGALDAAEVILFIIAVSLAIAGVVRLFQIAEWDN